MQANLLPLLNSNNCKALFTAVTSSTKSIQKDFARFLAAYFLNLPLIYSNDPKKHLPCLFEWTQSSQKDLLAKGYLLLPRDNLAARLSSDFSPRSAILLLCKCELYLEAVLYSDFFNDFRTGLILRFYAEKVLGLNLIQNTFESVTENLFSVIEEFNGAEQKLQDVTASITAHIECIVQISVVFDMNILRNVESEVIQQIEYLFLSFESRVPFDILLPRPPVFSLPAQFGMQNNLELKIWNKIYFLIKLYIGLLQRTNRLHVILAKVLEQVNSAFIHSSDEDIAVVNIPPVSESDNEIFEESLDNFYCLLLVVLRIFYRDNLSIAKNEEWDGIEIMEETYALLFPSSKIETDEQMFQNFLNNATESEFDSIFTFLHYLRENYRQKEVFLPPLSNDTLQQWQNVYSSSATLLRRDSSYETEPEWMFPEKLNLTAPDISKVKFLSNVMKTIFLNDPKLIQICLRIIPDDIFVADSFTVTQQLSILNEEIFTPINATISQKVHVVEKAISSEESDIDLDLYELEVKKEREFIRRLHISPVYYPPMSDNYRPKLAPPRIKPGGEIKPTNAKYFAATTLNDKLKQELESISNRLANLRPTQMPINIQISPSLQSNRKISQRTQGTFVTSSSSLESSSSISKKFKHESKARMKRDRQKKNKIQQFSSSSLSTNIGEEEEGEEVAKEQTDTSEAKRQRDYLQDMTLIPEPKLPKMEKLNLDQLSPPIQKKEDRTWQQIEIYSPSLDEAKNNNSIEMSSINNDMVVNNQPMRHLPISATQPLKPGYPEWLRLIPPKDDDSGRPNTSTSRLLDIELATKLAKKSNNSDSFKRYDSGFLDEVTTSQRSTKQTNRGISNKSPIAFAYSMTQEQINELENLCN
uniref:Uncharacterized protein n=1 Tax=Panagrolaimus sp. PS1159 TaxID=55785 RepID=A0AC35FJT7_9BILA